MQNKTTAYDSMSIARIKGERRAVRRMLAERSRALLNGYRRGVEVDPTTCPLARALDGAREVSGSALSGENAGV